MNIFTRAIVNSVIGIDEGQFFQDVVAFADKAANSSKIVLVGRVKISY